MEVLVAQYVQFFAPGAPVERSQSQVERRLLRAFHEAGKSVERMWRYVAECDKTSKHFLKFNAYLKNQIEAAQTDVFKKALREYNVQLKANDPQYCDWAKDRCRRLVDLKLKLKITIKALNDVYTLIPQGHRHEPFYFNLLANLEYKQLQLVPLEFDAVEEYNQLKEFWKVESKIPTAEVQDDEAIDLTYYSDDDDL